MAGTATVATFDFLADVGFAADATGFAGVAADVPLAAAAFRGAVVTTVGDDLAVKVGVTAACCGFAAPPVATLAAVIMGAVVTGAVGVAAFGPVVAAALLDDRTTTAGVLFKALSADAALCGTGATTFCDVAFGVVGLAALAVPAGFDPGMPDCLTTACCGTAGWASVKGFESAVLLILFPVDSVVGATIVGLLARVSNGVETETV